jgi:hypothetical protein
MTESELIHNNPWNPASRWGGWSWSEPRHDEFFRRCSFCGSIHPEDLAAEPASSGSCLICGKVGWSACFNRFDREAEDEHSYTTDGWYASWADFKYGWPHKFYIEALKPHDPDVLSVLSATSSVKNINQDNRWVLIEDLTPEQKRIIEISGWGRSRETDYVAFQFWHRPNCFAKFYTEHLKDPNISQEAKDTIERVSGLHFEWLEDGRVAWSKYQVH